MKDSRYPQKRVHLSLSISISLSLYLSLSRSLSDFAAHIEQDSASDADQGPRLAELSRNESWGTVSCQGVPGGFSEMLTSDCSKVDFEASPSELGLG